MSYVNVRTALIGGAAAALLSIMTACSEPLAAPDPRLRLVLTVEADVLAAGDIVAVEVAAVDGEGNPVAVGPVTLATDHPAVAVVDASARLRAVSAGRTTLRAHAGSVVGSTEVEVLGAPGLFELELFEGDPPPVLVAADSVDWNGEREYHELFAVSGGLTLTGGAEPRYELLVRYEEYDVRFIGGERAATPRFVWNEYDRGTVEYDAAGDLAMTSELIAPLHHRSTPVPGGFVVDFRIPGSDERLELFFRR